MLRHSRIWAIFRPTLRAFFLTISSSSIASSSSTVKSQWLFDPQSSSLTPYFLAFCHLRDNLLRSQAIFKPLIPLKTLLEILSGVFAQILAYRCLPSPFIATTGTPPIRAMTHTPKCSWYSATAINSFKVYFNTTSSSDQTHSAWDCRISRLTTGLVIQVALNIVEQYIGRLKSRQKQCSRLE